MSEYSGEDVKAHRRFVEGIQQADQLVLYEGLPDRGARTYESELAAKKTLMLHGWAFYEERLPISAEDGAKLASLCCDPASFYLDPADFKACLFHADYCAEWRNGEDITRLLFCFSCGDVWGYRAWTDRILAMNDDAARKFAVILVPYRKNRPLQASKLL